MPVALGRERRLLPSPVGLPLVVEGLIAVVKVDGPVVDQVRPGRNALANRARNQVLAGDDEVLEHHSGLVALPKDIEINVSKLEEANGIRFSDLALHDFARNLAELKVESSPPSVLWNCVVQPHLPLPPEEVARLGAVVGHFVHNFFSLVDRHWSVRGANVDHAPGLAPVQLEEEVVP